MAAPSTTNISELPIDPGLSAASNNIVLEQKEKKSFCKTSWRRKSRKYEPTGI